MQTSPALDPTRPHINVAILGHSGHGKSELACALTERTFAHDSRPWSKHTRRIEYVDRPVFTIRGDRVRHVRPSLIELETAYRHYDEIDVPGARRLVDFALMACGVADAVILVVSAVDGALAQTREHALFARALGVASIVVFVSNCDRVSDPDQLDLAENDVREVLTDVGYDGDGVSFVRGALGDAMRSDTWAAAIDDLIATIDREVADPARDHEASARAMVMFRYDTAVTRSQVAMIHLRQGVVHRGARMSLVFRGQVVSVVVEELRAFDREIEAAGPGDIVTVRFRSAGGEIGWTDVLRRGAVLTANGPAALARGVVASLRLLTRDEGGRSTPIFAGHRGQFCFGATQVSGRILLPVNMDDAMPGTRIERASVAFQYPVPIAPGARFVIRDGSDGLQRRFGGAPKWSGTFATGSVDEVDLVPRATA